MSSQFCDMLDIRMVYKLRARHYFCTNANLKIVVTIIFLHTMHQIPSDLGEVLPALYQRQQTKTIDKYIWTSNNCVTNKKDAKQEMILVKKDSQMPNKNDWSSRVNELVWFCMHQ
jgi:hypothetical protein